MYGYLIYRRPNRKSKAEIWYLLITVGTSSRRSLSFCFTVSLTDPAASCKTKGNLAENKQQNTKLIYQI